MKQPGRDRGSAEEHYAVHVTIPHCAAMAMPPGFESYQGMGKKEEICYSQDEVVFSE